MRHAVGWWLFVAATGCLRAAGRLHGRQCPLGVLCLQLAERLGSVSRSAAEPV